MCPFSRFLLMLCFRPGFSLKPLLSHLTLIGLFVASFSPAPLLGFEMKKKMAEKGRGSNWQDWTLSSRRDAQVSSNCASRMTWTAHALTLCRNKIASFRDSPCGHWGSSLSPTEKKKSLGQATGPQRLFLGVVSLGNIGVPPPLRPTASETGGGSPHTTHLCLSKPYRSFRCYSRVWEPLNLFLVSELPSTIIRE